MKFNTLLVVAAAIALPLSSPALAITDGELDGDRHPAVGLMVFDVDGFPEWRCSGTLISPYIMLTAGHCTFGATGGRVWFESDVQAGFPDNGYPFGGPTSVEFAEIHTHPDYDDEFFWLADVGIVVLEEPVYLESYPVLPALHELDVLETRRGLQETWFTSVGYGLQRINPVFEENERVRMVSYPNLIQIGSKSIWFANTMLLTNNRHTGGTCFGDSGGPNFLGDSDIIAAVTSYGQNDNCAGVGGVYRLDSFDAQWFIYSFLEP